MITAPRQNPIFVLCPPRSCSTVITAMLGQHPSLYAFPELNPFHCDTLGDLLDTKGRAGPVRAVGEVLLGGQDEATIDRAIAWLQARRAWAPADLLNLLLARVGPRAGVEKSPGTLATQTGCRRMLEMFPHARFIHLVRHPVSSLQSLERFMPERGWVDRDHDDPRGEAALLWYVYHRRLCMLGEQMDSSRWCRIRAEDILGDPPGNLRAVCGWLGIDDSPFAISCMSHPENWPYASVAPGRLTGGDHHFMRSPEPRFHAQDLAIPLPPDWSLPDKLGKAIDALGQSFGYGSIFETALAH
ncbi:MAG TPA: sulfotransferase [Solirubrobacteraceae bacterium]